MKKILFLLWILILFLMGFAMLRIPVIQSFIGATENRTFDIRQKFSSETKLKNFKSNIVIVAIDDASYEYILDKYGEWPLKREIYAKLIDFVEAQKPASIAFDLMFVKSLKSSLYSDKMLIDAFRKYDNVYTAMNLDNQPVDLREPANLPKSLAIDVFSERKLSPLQYSNCRTILPQIIENTSNIGMINVSRSDDGVLRQMPLFLKYKNNYYPQLGLKVALDYIGKRNSKNLYIDKKFRLNLDKNNIVNVTKTGEVILNWYGPSTTFENISMYKLLKSIENNESYKYDFKDKIVYFGATASSLFDIKTVPTDKVYPGVEVQATYVNNLINGHTIKKLSQFGNNVIIIVLALLTVVIISYINSIFISFALTSAVYLVYIFITYLTMLHFNVWLNIVEPLCFAVFAFIITVAVKYLIKVRDFDYQYKLATTDGLTGLYNHRYFQEQMKHSVLHSQRYNESFSLIIADIDFFKSFNDNFGHQSGDAVLRQVATILKKNVRITDIACRYGGEEMSIILPNTSYKEAVDIANKLCNLVSSQKFRLTNQRESNVTISLGVSSFPADGYDVATLIEKADSRLYNAKNNGRNRVN